jgi:hypothetical protein
MIDKRFRIIPHGVSYSQLFTDVELKCQSCHEIVNKVVYEERTGIGTWICKNMHLSKEKIGV